MTDELITSLVVQDSPQRSVDVLMEKALAHGAADNVTLIVVQVSEAS